MNIEAFKRYQLSTFIDKINLDHRVGNLSDMINLLLPDLWLKEFNILKNFIDKKPYRKFQ